MMVLPTPSAFRGPLAYEAESGFITRSRIFTFASLVILLVATIDEPFIGLAATAAWLVSFTIACRVDAGAAVGLYVASACVFYTRRVDGWASVSQRPDNYALLILVGALILRGFGGRQRQRDLLGLAVAIFFVGCLGQAAALGILTRSSFALFMRTYGIPLSLYLLLRRARLDSREVATLFAMLCVVGVYTACVSVLEQADLRYLALPPWVADPGLNVTIGSGRSGGVFLQSEWNGLALGLAFCIAVAGQLTRTATSWLSKVFVGAMCSLALFFTYTRGAWLATTLAGALLVWRWSANARRFSPKWIAAGWVVLAGVLLSVGVPRGTASDRIGDSGTVLYRLNVWLAAARMVADHPLVGIGFGQFPARIGDYNTDIGIVPFTRLQSGAGNIAHNTPIGVLAEHGVFGFVLYLVILSAVYRSARAGASRRWNGGSTLVDALMITYVVNTQFVFAHDLATNVMFYAVLGVLAGSPANTVTTVGAQDHTGANNSLRPASLFGLGRLR